MTNPNQRFSVGLVPTPGAAPAPPPATAAPAAVPAAVPEAGVGERVELTEADINIIESGVRVAGHVSAEAGADLIADWRRMRAAERAAYDLMMDAERERVAAEAERDRLAASNAELSATLSRLDTDWERTCAAVRREYEAERDALRAEVAALRGAMPDPAMLDYVAGQLRQAARNIHIGKDIADGYLDSERVLTNAAAAIAATMGEVIHDDPAATRAAALATATAPQAAGTGTGDQTTEWRDCDCGLCARCNGQAIRQAPVWAREAPAEAGEYWAIVDRWSEPAPQMVSLKVAESGDTWWASDSYDATYGYSPHQILLWGPIAITSIPPGWREALAALDQGQEADHAAR